VIKMSAKIRLDLTSEEALSGSEKARSGVQYPFVDVWDFQCTLAWMVFSDDGNSSHVEQSMKWEQEKLGVSDDMLLAAVRKSGGSISRNGHFPISAEIRAKLEKAA
jgi:hypothetical protein